ncbi:MAG TPA: hypothetical protein VGQ17_11120 [Gemmatimonadales bacterium]|jgi:hypothetical protein|nr:hypothetical protein [Gemmatimonadales bacterium]
MKLPAAISAVALAWTTAVSAQDQLAPLIARGLASLRAGECTAAFKGWTEQWTGPEEAAKRDQMIAGCGMLARFGTLRGYDVLRSVNVSPHVQRAYIILLYDKQPVYFMIVLYRPEAAWKVQTLNWNTDYDKVVPAGLFGEEHPRP